MIWISKSYDHPRQLTLSQKQKDPAKTKNSEVENYVLPAYSPSLAPIELIFGYFKMILKREWKSKIIKLAQKEGMNVFTSVPPPPPGGLGGGTDVNMNAIKNSLKKVSSEKIIGCFIQFYKELSLNIELIKHQLFSVGVVSSYY